MTVQSQAALFHLRSLLARPTPPPLHWTWTFIVLAPHQTGSRRLGSTMKYPRHLSPWHHRHLIARVTSILTFLCDRDHPAWLLKSKLSHLPPTLTLPYRPPVPLRSALRPPTQTFGLIGVTPSRPRAPKFLSHLRWVWRRDPVDIRYRAFGEGHQHFSP